MPKLMDELTERQLHWSVMLSMVVIVIYVMVGLCYISHLPRRWDQAVARFVWILCLVPVGLLSTSGFATLFVIISRRK